MNLFSNLGDFTIFFLKFPDIFILKYFWPAQVQFYFKRNNMMIDLLLHFKNVVRTKEEVSNLYSWLENFFNKVWKITYGWSLYLQIEDASVKILVSNQIWSSTKQTK